MADDIEAATRMLKTLTIWGEEEPTPGLCLMGRENVGRLDAECDVFVGGEDIPQTVVKAGIIPIVDSARRSIVQPASRMTSSRPGVTPSSTMRFISAGCARSIAASIPIATGARAIQGR